MKGNLENKEITNQNRCPDQQEEFQIGNNNNDRYRRKEGTMTTTSYNSLQQLGSDNARRVIGEPHITTILFTVSGAILNRG